MHPSDPLLIERAESVRQIDWCTTAASRSVGTSAPREDRRASPVDAAIKRITTSYEPRFGKIRWQIQRQLQSPQAVINQLIDLYNLEELMIHALCQATGDFPERLAQWRVLRRAEIDLLRTCAEEVGDVQAKLLAELLLDHLRARNLAAQAHLMQEVLPGF